MRADFPIENSGWKHVFMEESGEAVFIFGD